MSDTNNQTVAAVGDITHHLADEVDASSRLNLSVEPLLMVLLCNEFRQSWLWIGCPWAVPQAIVYLAK